MARPSDPDPPATAGSPPAREIIRRWLETPEADPILNRAAELTLIEARRMTLSLLPLGWNGGWEAAPPDLVDEIRAELTRFLLERAGAFAEAVSRRAPPAALANHLKRIFLNRWIDRTRNPDDDRQRYLRKRAGDLFRESTDVTTRRDGSGRLVFSRSASDPIAAPMALDDIAAIPFPTPVEPRFEAVNTRLALLSLAETFLDAAADRHGGEPVAVDLSDFIRWIGLHVPLKRPRRDETPADESTGVGGAPDPPSPQPLHDLARTVAAKLTDDQRRVIRRRRIEDRTFAEIADEFGYASPSGAKAFHDRAVVALRTIIAAQGWRLPEDEDAISSFLDFLMMVL